MLEAVRYRQNYLTKVIFQLQFSPILALLKEAPASFQADIQADFPRLKEGREVEVRAEMSKGGVLELTERKHTPRWIFETSDGSKSVTVAANLFSLEYNRYESVEVLRSDFEKLWRQFQVRYHVEVVTRVGLRYINEVVLQGGSTFDWRGYINARLADSAVNVPTASLERLRSIHYLVLGNDTDRCVVRYGLFNKDFPNPIAERRFMLDYDCHSTEELQVPEVREKLDQYHGIIQRLFEDSIDDGLRDIMGRDE